MRTPIAIAVLLSPLCLSEVGAAPAPLPKPEAASEAVFDAKTPERCRSAVRFIRSSYFSGALLENKHARQSLPRFESDEAAQAWLKANLTVTDEGTLVRVRLRGPVSALAVIADYLTG